MDMSDQLHAHATLQPGKEPPGGWVDAMVGLDATETK